MTCSLGLICKHNIDDVLVMDLDVEAVESPLCTKQSSSQPLMERILLELVQGNKRAMTF